MDESRNGRITRKLIRWVFFIVFYLFFSGGTEYFFKPKLLGQRVQMHTLLVFFLISGGLQLFAILGIIFRPLVVTGFLTMTNIYHASYQNLVEPLKTCYMEQLSPLGRLSGF